MTRTKHNYNIPGSERVKGAEKDRLWEDLCPKYNVWEKATLSHAKGRVGFVGIGGNESAPLLGHTFGSGTTGPIDT